LVGIRICAVDVVSELLVAARTRREHGIWFDSCSRTKGLELGVEMREVRKRVVLPGCRIVRVQEVHVVFNMGAFMGDHLAEV